MAKVKLYGLTDVDGIIETYNERIKNHYKGKDPTTRRPNKELVELLLENAKKPLQLEYKTTSISKFVSLISSRRGTTGCDLQVYAQNGDEIYWQGLTSSHDSYLRAVIYDVHGCDKLKKLEKSNITYKRISSAVDPNDSSKGFIVETENEYSITCELQGKVGEIIPYNMEILILSDAFEHNGKLISVPIVKLVVDPNIIVAR